MQLNETIEMMLSPDYKERFKAEYWQLRIRCNSLESMLFRYKAGTLDFKPTCSYDILDEQLRRMRNYLCILESRAEIEEIELSYEGVELL